MTISSRDFNTLRTLAGKYSEIARLEIQEERMARYRRSNGLDIVRPVVLIDEVPWGEIRDEALTPVCAPELGWLEGQLRRTLYQWEHFQADMVVPPVFRVGKGVRSTGIGVRVKDEQIKGDTGAYITSHEYTDQLQTEADLAKLRLPEISYDKTGTEKRLAVAGDVFDGLMPVTLSGHTLNANIWDDISALRGVDNLLMDLAMRPDFMHQTARKFMDIIESRFTQYEELELLESNPILVHCTPACTDELPSADFTGTVRRKDVWGRCAAQIFGSVSPAMHDEFDLAYNQQVFSGCGLLYYGCCEPMDNKIDILRARFANLRKISITPWADPDRAARHIGGDYVLAAKPNPALVSRPAFDPKPVEAEIARYCEACREYKTPLEFVLKDVSTIANRPENLTRWCETVSVVLDRYYE
ncbi:MAG: hypothetical protein RRC34_04760 [Lentisphaeria bacterium]|nr:hypothetical protein [Lentisphaeria bacterium]